MINMAVAIGAITKKRARKEPAKAKQNTVQDKAKAKPVENKAKEPDNK